MSETTYHDPKLALSLDWVSRWLRLTEPEAAVLLGSPLSKNPFGIGGFGTGGARVAAGQISDGSPGGAYVIGSAARDVRTIAEQAMASAVMTWVAPAARSESLSISYCARTMMVVSGAAARIVRVASSVASASLILKTTRRVRYEDPGEPGSLSVAPSYQRAWSFVP